MSEYKANAMEYVPLDTLSWHHPLRARPLDGAMVRIRASPGEEPARWRRIKGWRIGKLSYNDLGPLWTEANEFQFDDRPL